MEPQSPHLHVEAREPQEPVADVDPSDAGGPERRTRAGQKGDVPRADRRDEGSTQVTHGEFGAQGVVDLLPELLEDDAFQERPAEGVKNTREKENPERDSRHPPSRL